MSKLKKIIQEEIQKFLSEAHGTPNAIKGYVKEVTDEFAPLIKRYIEEMDSQGIDNVEFDEDVNFKSQDPDFPMGTLSLPITISIQPGSGKVLMDGAFYKSIDKEGVSNPIIKLSINSNPDVSVGLIEDELDSILTHELTHAYEIYKRGGQWGDKGRFINKITDSELDKKYPVIWKYFLGLIYQTIDFEVNARVSQVAKMAQRLKEQGKTTSEVMDAVKKTDEWETLENWESFTPDLVIGHINNLIDQQGLREKGYDADKIINAYKKGIATTFDGQNMELSPKEIKFLNDSEDMSPMEFLSFWQGEFKREAESYRRRMLKAIGSE